MAEFAPTVKGFMVFDVESIGLHGEGFAVGIIVLDMDGQELFATRFACSRDLAAGTGEDRDWIAHNVPDIEANCANPKEVRDSFWKLWEQYSAQNMLLAADNGWPVEARFLIACIDDEPHQRKGKGPHPFVEIGSVLLACDPDRVFDYGRLANELPEHEPLADARRSARLLLTSLRHARGSGPISLA